MVLKFGFTTLTVCSGKNLTAVPVEVIIEPLVCLGFTTVLVIGCTSLWFKLKSNISCWSATLISLLTAEPNVTCGSFIYPLPAFVIDTPVISPSLSNVNSAVAVTLVGKRLPKASFDCGCGNTICGAVVYLLSAKPTILTVAILLARGLAATDPNKLDQLEPSVLIVILSLSNFPSESIPIVTVGATPVWPDISMPLNDIAGADVYPNPGSAIVTDSKAPSNLVAVAVAVSPVNEWFVPEPAPVISISTSGFASVASGFNLTLPPEDVCILYWSPETNPGIAPPPEPELYVTIELTGKADCWALVSLIVLLTILTIPVPNTSSSLPSNVIADGAAMVSVGTL